MFCNRCGTQFDHTYTNVCPNCGNVMETGTFNQTNVGNPSVVAQNSFNDQVQPRYDQPINAVPDTSSSVLTWGIVGLAFSCVPYINFLGIIFSGVGRGKVKEYLKNHNNVHNGKTKTGSILSTIGLISGIVQTIVYVILIIGFVAALTSYSYYY